MAGQCAAMEPVQCGLWGLAPKPPRKIAAMGVSLLF
jgi:hypothetical protein